jgi:hypothetical protein
VQIGSEGSLRAGSKRVKRRRTKTTIAIHQVYVVREPESFAPVLCPECATGAASMVTPEEAASATGVARRSIYRLIEAGLIHYLEATDDSLLVCLNSIPTIGNPDEFG